jgi:hypothetical protein
MVRSPLLFSNSYPDTFLVVVKRDIGAIVSRYPNFSAIIKSSRVHLPACPNDDPGGGAGKRAYEGVGEDGGGGQTGECFNVQSFDLLLAMSEYVIQTISFFQCGQSGHWSNGE